MSIHSSTLSSRLLFNLNDPADDRATYFRQFGFSEEDIQRILDDNNHDSVTIKCDLTHQHPNLGIESVSITKTPDREINALYYITIRINPQLLITKHRTIELFSPSAANNLLLFRAFREAMSIFDNNYYSTNICHWYCARLDMTHDFRFETSEQAGLFMDMVHRSSRYIRRRGRVSVENLDLYNQSAAEANKSYKIICYDKQKEIRDTFQGVPDEEMNILLSQAENIIRYEIQCEKNKISYIKKSNNFDSRSIWNYLNEDIIHQNLQKAFRETVGEGDFCDDSRVQQLLDNSDMRQSMKTNLYNFMCLLSQAGDLAEGKELFLEGSTIFVDGEEVSVHGSLPTFYNRIKKLKELGINPIMIPEAWATKYNIQELSNPYHDLLI